MKENIGFIGAGNMCQAIIEGWLSKSLVTAAEIGVSNRTPGKLRKLVDELKVVPRATNEELVDASDVVVIAVKPQDFETAIEPIASSFTADQIVISLAAGVSLRKIKKLLPQCQHLVRVMANTPARIGRGVFGYCTPLNNLRVDRWMERMFKPLGYTVKLDEGEQFEAFLVSSSSGVGFVFELMIYWQEWLEERGIEPEIAQAITVNTFAGAAELALESQPLSVSELQSKVVSKKGTTAAGLESMRELELERLLRYSFEKSALRDRELGQD
ncbi:MAG TPA: pyrroline-5-carboxylate reductase [Bdellovibrionales bacterium]|nr:pyrroline-5-carboxylate reductase [Bdellovibrionales bacterium]